MFILVYSCVGIRNKAYKGIFSPLLGGIYGTGMGAEPPQWRPTVVSQEKQRNMEVLHLLMESTLATMVMTERL